MARKAGIPRKKGPQFTVLVGCKIRGCKKKRWVMPQDVFHVTRCDTHQSEHNRQRRAERARQYRLRQKKAAKKAA